MFETAITNRLIALLTALIFNSISQNKKITILGNRIVQKAKCTAPKGAVQKSYIISFNMFSISDGVTIKSLTG